MDIGIQKLPEEIIPLMTDMADVHGCYIAIRLLQLELAEFSDSIHVGQVDGVVGQKTIEAARRVIAFHGRLFVNHLGSVDI
jgi:lysozyme family protein